MGASPSRHTAARPGLSGAPSQTDTESNGFSLTEMGREWISKYDQEVLFPAGPGRFATLLISYGNRFGPAFKQRITEANGCYRTLNYFAACAMAGAACESILLAIGSAKIGEKALRTYIGRDGRRLLIKEITTNLSSSLKQPVETAASILSYWRDASRARICIEITEFSAHDALSRLLRFAQFVDRNWDQLTAISPPYTWYSTLAADNGAARILVGELSTITRSLADISVDRVEPAG